MKCVSIMELRYISASCDERKVSLASIGKNPSNAWHMSLSYRCKLHNDGDILNLQDLR